jgi:transposase
MVTERLTHEDRRERRKSMAADYTGGMTTKDICKKYDVSPMLVSHALSEFGIPSRRDSQRVGSRTFDVLKSLMDGGRNVDVAAEFGVSREWVRQIHDRAVEAGILKK